MCNLQWPQFYLWSGISCRLDMHKSSEPVLNLQSLQESGVSHMQTPKEGVTECEHGANFLKFQSQGLCYYFLSHGGPRAHLLRVCVHVQTVLFVSFDLNDTPGRWVPRPRCRRGSCVPTGTAPGSGEMPSPLWAIKRIKKHASTW